MRGLGQREGTPDESRDAILTTVVRASAAVEIRGLAHRYPLSGEPDGLLALDDVHMTVGDGEFVALVGPSGCGKSTLISAIAGLLEPTDGSLEVLGRAARAAGARHELGLVTQDPGLLPWRTVADNVRLTLDVTGKGSTAELLHQLLALVGMERFAAYYPGELSGGMKQRVALARALAHGPRLLLMDEPFGALDELSREEMRLELLRIWERDRVSVLFVTHAIREAVLLADRVLVMSPRPGRIVADVEVDLPRPRTSVTDETPEFRTLVARVRAALRSAT